MEMKLATDCWIEAEENLRKIDPNKICNFGIQCMDDALKGILPNDLIVIGGDSGVGKSETGLDIAIHNAKNNRKVALYFIEGGAEEAINRIRWKLISNKYYEQKHTSINMDYSEWRMNRLRCELLDKLNYEAFIEFKNIINKNLHIYSFEESFTIQMLTNSLGWFSEERPGEFLNESFYNVDLIIIDHLQYFTLTNPKNEFTEMTQILMKVKDITNFHNIPVILISHLRKKDKDRGLPSQEDFFGTSNIAKIASQAITITSAPSGESFATGKYPTFFRFVKSRTGIRPSVAVLCDFNQKTGKYDNEYSVYSLIGDKPAASPLERFKLPKWAYKHGDKNGSSNQTQME